MSELEARFRVSITGKDELGSFFDKSLAASKRFASGLSQDLNKAGRDIASFGATAAKGLAALAGIGGGIDIARRAQGVLELRDAIAGVAASAGLSEEKIAGLTERIIQVSKATNQFGKDSTEALSAFVAKTGDIEGGVKNLELFGRVATATRASMSDIANIGADLSKLKITGDQSSAFAILAKQSDVGSVELRDLVSQGPRLLSAFQSAGLTGERGLREGGALAQMFQKGTGNVERTSTAVEATFRDIAAKAPGIESALGVKNIFGRDRVEVLQEIIRKTKGSEQQLRRIFGDEAYRGVSVLANEFRETGGFGTFESFRDVQADGSTIDRKFGINSSTGMAKLKAAEIAKEVSADRNLGGAASFVANNADVGAGVFDFVTGNPLMAGLIGFGGLAAKNAASRMIASRMGGGGGAGGATSALGALAGGGAMPVQVVNWPQGGVPGADAIAGVGTAAAGASKGLGLLGMAVQNAGTLFATFAAAYAVGSYADKKLGISDALSGTGKNAAGQSRVVAADEAAFEGTGGRAARELASAKGLAAQVASGKLTPAQAARQFAGFARSAEKTGRSDSRLSDSALNLMAALEAGDVGGIGKMTEAGIRDEANWHELRPGADKKAAAYRARLEAAEAPLPGSYGPAAPDMVERAFAGAEELERAFSRALKAEGITIHLTTEGDAAVEGKGTRSTKVKMRRSAAGAN